MRTWISAAALSMCIPGCSSPEAAAPPATPAATPAPTPAAAAPEAPAAPAAAPGAPPAFLATAPMGVGHCDPSERAVFSCATGKGKFLSLCSDDTLSQLQYRFGDPESPDLRAPASSSPSEFHYGHTAWVRGEEHSVRFTQDGHTYTVVSALGGDGAENNYSGVKVTKDDKELAFVKCVDAPVADNLQLLAGVLP